MIQPRGSLFGYNLLRALQCLPTVPNTNSRVISGYLSCVCLSVHSSLLLSFGFYKLLKDGGEGGILMITTVLSWKVKIQLSRENESSSRCTLITTEGARSHIYAFKCELKR